MEVERAVDGDTVEVEILSGSRRGETEDVRLIGIDTPEVDHGGDDHDCYALVAWQEVIDLVEGRRAWMTFDAECTDFYGRTLAYLWRDEDGLFLNRHLVAEGFARACPISPNSAFSSDLASLEQEAQDQGLGRWGEPCLGGPECFQGGR